MPRNVRQKLFGVDTADLFLEKNASHLVSDTKFVQVQQGSEQRAKARKEVRQAVVQNAEIVTCTISSAGGDLLTLSKGSVGFQALIIDEVISLSIINSSLPKSHCHLTEETSKAVLTRLDCDCCLPALESCSGYK